MLGCKATRGVYARGVCAWHHHAYPGFSLAEITATAMMGIKGIMPAVIILAFAYALNDFSAALNTAEYVVTVTRDWLSPVVLPAVVFLICALIAFMIRHLGEPMRSPFLSRYRSRLASLAQSFHHFVLATLAAVAGGGIW